MEELCRRICGKIYSSTREGYGIFYEDELSDLLPEDNRTRESLEAVLKQLVNEGYIDVKYAKGNVFCILGLKNAEQQEQCASAAIQTDRADGINWRPLAWLCAAAALGGAAGSLVCHFILYAI